MLIDELSNGPQFVTAKPTVRRQRHRREPVLRVPASMRDMDVRRFPILQTVEEESIAAHSEEGRHSKSLLLDRPPHSRRRISAIKSFRGVTLPTSALRDRFEQHLLRLGICLERLVAFKCQHGYRRAFGQLRIDLDATIDDLSRCDSHTGIVASNAAEGGQHHGFRPPR